jgi:hypothetical protein
MARDDAGVSGATTTIERGDPEAAPPPAESSCDAVEVVRLVMHDARTPLNAIRGFGELLLTGAAGPLSGDALDYLRQVARAGRALELTLEQLQELVAPQRRPGGTPLAPVDLASVAAAAGCVVGDGFAGGAAVVLGSRQGWRRVLELCRRFLAAGDADGGAVPAVIAEFERDGHEGGPALRLRRRGGGPGDGTGLLAVELARRLAAGEGARLSREAPDRLLIALPPERAAAAAVDLATEGGQIAAPARPWSEGP